MANKFYVSLGGNNIDLTDMFANTTTNAVNTVAPESYAEYNITIKSNDSGLSNYNFWKRNNDLPYAIAGTSIKNTAITRYAVFTSTSNSYDLPPSSAFTYVSGVMIGGGGGGGGGGSGPASNGGTCGAPGGGSPALWFTCDRSVVPNTIKVVVGTGGAGHAGTNDSNAPGYGGVGGSSGLYKTDGSELIVICGGDCGGSGNNANPNGGNKARAALQWDYKFTNVESGVYKKIMSTNICNYGLGNTTGTPGYAKYQDRGGGNSGINNTSYTKNYNSGGANYNSTSHGANGIAATSDPGWGGGGSGGSGGSGSGAAGANGVVILFFN